MCGVGHHQQLANAVEHLNAPNESTYVGKKVTDEI